MTINMYIATVAWLLLSIGLFNRHKKLIHIRCMVSGIGLDIALVLYLQLTRDAVQQAAEFSLPVLHQFHILFSTLALLLYFPILFLGFQLVKGQLEYLALHKKLGISAYLLRSAGFVFMFSLLQ